MLAVLGGRRATTPGYAIASYLKYVAVEDMDHHVIVDGLLDHRMQPHRSSQTAGFIYTGPRLRCVREWRKITSWFGIMELKTAGVHTG
jgi:hypothetical protein